MIRKKCIIMVFLNFCFQTWQSPFHTWIWFSNELMNGGESWSCSFLEPYLILSCISKDTQPKRKIQWGESLWRAVFPSCFTGLGSYGEGHVRLHPTNKYPASPDCVPTVSPLPTSSLLELSSFLNQRYCFSNAN